MRADPGRGLGDALLDQHLVAGIGNIFKSEACFAARLDPWRPVGELSEEELRTVLAAARSLMLGAVESGRQPQEVYRRRQGACRRCGGPISSRGQGDANRTTYWCPRCQG
jgi:endonuclease-8